MKEGIKSEVVLDVTLNAHRTSYPSGIVDLEIYMLDKHGEHIEGLYQRFEAGGASPDNYYAALVKHCGVLIERESIRQRANIYQKEGEE